MKSRELYKIAERILMPDLKPLGFETKSGIYVRELGSGVLHIIGIGMDPHGQKTFRIMCGLNATQINLGVDKFYTGMYKRDPHLTPRGWDGNSGSWPCATEDEMTESLMRVRELLLELAIPWFDAHQTLSSVAEEIHDGQQGIYKSKLYQLDKRYDLAEQSLNDFFEWQGEKPSRWYPENLWTEDRNKALVLLKEIESFK